MRLRRSSSAIRALVEMSVESHAYVCDRVNDRVQVFKPDGTFVKEAFFNKQTLGSGSAWTSPSRKTPAEVHLPCGWRERQGSLIERESLEILTTFAKADVSR